MEGRYLFLFSITSTQLGAGHTASSVLGLMLVTLCPCERVVNAWQHHHPLGLSTTGGGRSLTLQAPLCSQPQCKLLSGPQRSPCAHSCWPLALPWCGTLYWKNPTLCCAQYQLQLSSVLLNSFLFGGSILMGRPWGQNPPLILV